MLGLYYYENILARTIISVIHSALLFDTWRGIIYLAAMFLCIEETICEKY